MVEPEGPGGLQMQAGRDLSSTEIKQLTAFITTGIQRLKNHNVVFTGEGRGIYLSIVAVKVGVPGQTWIAVSSALSVGDPADKTNPLEPLTGDVIVERTVERVAASVVAYLASAELRGSLGLH
jgi:hypothetical protein